MVSALVVAVLITLYDSGAALGDFDRVEPGQEGVDYPIRSLALAIDFGGEPLGAGLLVAILVAVCLALRSRRLAVLAIVGPALAVIATTLLKPVADRIIHGEFLSFPSGHTALATALGLIVGLLAVTRPPADALRPLPAAALVLGTALVCATAMAWAQVSLGAHYPTDTVGGFCTATALVVPAAWLIDQAAPPHHP